MINHFKHWNRWRKLNLNGPVYQILVLLGLAVSPTFELSKGIYDEKK